MQLFCNLYSSLRWQVHGNLLRCRVIHLLVAREDFCVLYARLFGEHFAILPGYLLAMFMQDSPKIIRQYCHISVWQALCKVILESTWQYCRVTFWQFLLKAAPKTKWQCCHATFLQSLCKFALACTWQPTQIPKTTFIGCQARCLGPLCKVVKKVLRNIAR